MKGFLKFGALALVVVLVSGCGSKGKVLKCTMSENTFGMNVEMAVNMTFENDKMTTVKEEVKYAIPEEYKDLIDINDLKDELDEDYSELKDNKNFKYSSKVKGDTFIANFEFDVTKFNEDELESLLPAETANLSYDAAKKAFEDKGITCK